MGKKKSVVLMTLLTIVIVVLSALTVFPSFAIPGMVKDWTPAIKQYDLGKDLGGGYYTYYYPEGVISETEYDNNLKMLQEEDKQDYEESYLQCGGLYLSKDEDKNLVREVEGKEIPDPDFEKSLADAAKVIADRYKALGYSDFKVSIVDKYSIKVELPKSEALVGDVMSLFANTNALTIEKGGETIDELKSKDAKVTDLIKSFSVSTRLGVTSLNVNFTKDGKTMIKEEKSSLSVSTETTDTSSATTLDLKIGDAVVSIFQDHINDRNEVKVPLQYEENKAQVEILNVLYNSVLNEGELDVTFRSVTTSEIRSFEPNTGKNILTATYIALGIVILAACALSVWKMGRFGIVNVYSILSYLIVVGLCYGFITKAVFEITLASIFVFLLGLLIISTINVYIYKAIKGEYLAGKTVASAVKSGYNKTLGGVIDTYAVMLLIALALLIGVAGVFTLSLQALICIITAAFCSLLWGRAINFVFLSASKDKYKYFRFVREEDDDDE